MIDLNKFAAILNQNSVEFISGVPDTLLNDFCLYVEENWPEGKHVLAANEGNAVALAAGYHLATNTIPLVYMQNSGIGNALSPLISLTHPDVYGIPLILLVGWRGEPGVKDHPQHNKQGQITPILMEDVDIPWKRLTNDIDEAKQSVDWAVERAKEIRGPVALLVPKGVLERGEKSGFEDHPGLMSREEAIHCIVNTMPSDTIFIAATGRATRELYEVRRLREESHENDFLNVGAMGHTSSIAAGVALANKNRLVVCLDGDASAIMHMGSIAVLGQKSCGNLIHIVLNNGVHESVGGQLSAGSTADMTSVAKNTGYRTIASAVKTKNEVYDSLNNHQVADKPLFIEIRIKKGIRANLPPLKFDLVENKTIFMACCLKRTSKG